MRHSNLRRIDGAAIRKLVAAIPGARRLKRRLVGPRGAKTVSPVRPSDRGPHPSVDKAELRAAYQRSELATEPESFVLYRIIGNDLVPRHRRGQSWENLAFILEHEPELRDCRKRFVVNRIVDRGEEASIVRMLEEAGLPYLHIPFEPEEYAHRQWDVAGVPLEYAPYTAAYGRLDPYEQDQIRMRLYRQKNRYAIHNNGARNAALRDGRRLAKWVLPWDGNCFLTADAWEGLRTAVAARPHVPYHVVPMARVTDNRVLLRSAWRPAAEEEPQILFRRDATLELDPEQYYGRRPKVELLWRLGVPGRWDGWPIKPWDLPCPEYAPEAGAFAEAGWVARLFSGQAELETGHATVALDARGRARAAAVIGLLDLLDARYLGPALQPERPVFIDCDDRNEAHPGLLRQLRAAADEALSRGPYSVVDKKTLAPSGDPHDYWHPAPYYWPHPLRLPGLPYVRRDGVRVPGTRLYEPLSDNYDRTRLQRLFDDGFVLALACARLGEARYGEHAARLVRHWFLDPGTAMHPHLRYAQVRRGHDGNLGSSRGVIEMKDLYYFLDAVRLLRMGGFLDEEELAAFRDWLARYLAWLRESDQGRGERAAVNNHGTYYDLQVGAIAAFLGDYLLLRDTLRDSRFRIQQQIDAEGRQPHELVRTTTAHYCCFNLQGWIHLATLAESVGEDLWSFEGPAGQSLQKAMEWLLPQIGRPWPYPQIDAFDDERLFPIYHAHRAQYGGRAGEEEAQVPENAHIKPLFFPHDGIRPFWQVR